MTKFVEKVEKKVKNTIEKYEMFSNEDRILIAISGGKDSAVAAHILKKLGYSFDCLHINVGIKNFSEKSESFARKQAKELNCNLKVIDVRKILGKSVEEVESNRPICSVCGLTRRYLMNFYAVEKKYSVIVTGHNLSDIASFYFSNIMNRSLEYAKSLKPVVKGSDSLVKKARPLFFLSDLEVEKYASYEEIVYLASKCPYSFKASSVKNKKLLLVLDEIKPGFSKNFVISILNVIQDKEDKKKLKKCKICGMPTNRDVCSFCTTWKLKNRIVI